MMFHYTNLTTRRRTQKNKALLICAYSLLVRYLLLSMYATRVITTEREKEREIHCPRVSTSQRYRRNGTKELRGSLTIAMHKIFVFIYAAKNLHSFWDFKCLLKKNSSPKKHFFFYKNPYKYFNSWNIKKKLRKNYFFLLVISAIYGYVFQSPIFS